MIVIEAWRNGKRIGFPAEIGRIVSAKLTIHNKNSPIILNVVGENRETGCHDSWAQASAKLGDEITLKLVEVDDTATAKPTDHSSADS